MRLTFTLQSAYTGSTYVAGPFNISGRTSGGVNYQLSTGVTKTQLTTGHTVDTIYETITGGTIVSTGSCSTSQAWSLTPTPTPTPTSNGTLLTSIGLQGNYNTCNNACAAYNSNPSYTTFYMTTANFNDLSATNGTLYTTSTANSSYYAASGFYYHSSGYVIQVGSSGLVNSVINQCNGSTCGGGVQL
jgi:hypothetical protein